MGGLAHYLEQEGLSTTQISLIRKHSEIIRPPRVLWVPFELGRPLGIPQNAEFQHRVLSACLTLLEKKEGPVLEDYSEDIPLSDIQTEQILACPVSITLPNNDTMTETERLIESFKQEINQLRPWYDISVQKRGRTTVGISGISIDVIPDFLGGFLSDTTPQNFHPQLSLSEVLSLVMHDVKTFYTESQLAQPGQIPSGRVITEWFKNQTIAAKIISKIHSRQKKI